MLAPSACIHSAIARALPGMSLRRDVRVVALLDQWWLASIKHAYDRGASTKDAKELENDTCRKIFTRIEACCLEIAKDLGSDHQKFNIENHSSTARSRIQPNGVEREQFCDAVYGFCGETLFSRRQLDLYSPLSSL